MTDRKELEALAARMEAKGATITFKTGSDGWISSVQIENAKRIGSHPMSPVSAAERMREWLAA